MATIFSSHSSQDNLAAEEICSRLRAHGYESLFLDFDFDPDSYLLFAVRWVGRSRSTRVGARGARRRNPFDRPTHASRVFEVGDRSDGGGFSQAQGSKSREVGF